MANAGGLTVGRQHSPSGSGSSTRRALRDLAAFCPPVVDESADSSEWLDHAAGLLGDHPDDVLRQAVRQIGLTRGRGWTVEDMAHAIIAAYQRTGIQMTQDGLDIQGLVNDPRTARLKAGYWIGPDGRLRFPYTLRFPGPFASTPIGLQLNTIIDDIDGATVELVERAIDVVPVKNDDTLADRLKKLADHVQSRVLFAAYGEPSRLSGGVGFLDGVAMRTTWLCLSQKTVDQMMQDYPKIARISGRAHLLFAQLVSVVGAADVKSTYGRTLQRTVEREIVARLTAAEMILVDRS